MLIIFVRRPASSGTFPLPLCAAHELGNPPEKAADPAMRDGPRLLRGEKPQRNPSADGYLCATRELDPPPGKAADRKTRSALRLLAIAFGSHKHAIAK
jgi:hypothetical protein